MSSWTLEVGSALRWSKVSEIFLHFMLLFDNTTGCECIVNAHVPLQYFFYAINACFV